MGSTQSMVGSALALAIVAVGCSLDVNGTGEFAAADDAGASDSSGGLQGDGSLARDANADAPPGFDAAATDGPLAPCDLDGDGHKATSCGGDDCCDNDARVHPGATDWQSGADACGSFDYDCNGQEEKQTPVANCQVTLGCQGSGFDKDTPCGADAAHTWCLGLLVCNPVHDSQTQKCR
jgi:hypothetical protein